MMEKQIEDLVSNREKFNEFVYTPVDEAIKELDKRQSENLRELIDKYLPIGAPKIFKNGKFAVMFRQLATPNYEARRFVHLIDGLDNFTPVFLEYLEDKFADINEWKYHLGKTCFYAGKGKNGGEKISNINIIDFNASNGKKIGAVKTIWGQSLVDFHHDFFKEAYIDKDNKIILFDASEWFSKSGGNAKEYYKNFLALFVSHGILFENFMLDVKEREFTEKIFLPAFMKVLNDTGKKPLIVALEPTEIETNLFWMCHPLETRKFIDGKMNSI